MMVEDYCSFETAMLLKEKGFDAEIKTYWCKGAHDEPIFEFIPNARNHDISNSEGYIHFNGHLSDLEDESVCIAPTLQMAMKWLREIHKIELGVQPFSYSVVDERTSSYVFSFWTDDNLNEPWTWKGDSEYQKNYLTYEEALEAGIIYCLENLERLTN